MAVHQDSLSVATHGRGTYELTRDVQQIVASSGIAIGLCNVFIHHTSAALIVSENADPDVRRDLETFFAALIRDGDPSFRHAAEGADDMAAHVRSVLTEVSVTLPITAGRCSLGTWQGVYLWEHRRHPHQRVVTVTVYGE